MWKLSKNPPELRDRAAEAAYQTAPFLPLGVTVVWMLGTLTVQAARRLIWNIRWALRRRAFTRMDRR